MLGMFRRISTKSSSAISRGRFAGKSAPVVRWGLSRATSQCPGPVSPLTPPLHTTVFPGAQCRPCTATRVVSMATDHAPPTQDVVALQTRAQNVVEMLRLVRELGEKQKIKKKSQEVKGAIRRITTELMTVVVWRLGASTYDDSMGSKLKDKVGPSSELHKLVKELDMLTIEKFKTKEVNKTIVKIVDLVENSSFFIVPSTVSSNGVTVNHVQEVAFVKDVEKIADDANAMSIVNRGSDEHLPSSEAQSEQTPQSIDARVRELERRIAELQLENASLNKGAAEKKLSKDAKTLSPEVMLDSVLQILEDQSVVAPREMWRVPDATRVRKILGLNFVPELTGRNDHIKKVVECAESSVGKDDRKYLNFISGLPGTGKTRLLFESANEIVKRQGNLGIIVCTFNGEQNADEHGPLELEMINISAALPVIVRLLFSCVGAEGVTWGTFLMTFLKELRETALLGQLRRLKIEVVIDLIVSHHKLDGAVVIVDETLRWLGVNHIRRSMTEEMITENMKRMVSDVCAACDKDRHMAIFTAFSSSFLDRTKSPSSREITTTSLTPLDPSSSKDLTARILQNCVGKISQWSNLTDAEVVDIIESEAVGGLPRAAEFLMRAILPITTRDEYRTLSMIIASVHFLLAARYIVEWAIVVLAMSRFRTWQLDSTLPGCDMTGRDAGRRGFLPMSSEEKATTVKIYLPPVLLKAALLHNKFPNDEIKDAAKYLASIASMSPRNLWEEVTFRTLILHSHLPQYFLTPGIPIREGIASTTENSSSAECRVLRSALDLFGGPNNALTNIPEISTETLLNTSLQVEYPLSNTVLKYPEHTPPRPSMFTEVPALMSHVYTSESAREPGVDGLLFLRKNTAAGELVALGIQCKWSDPNSTTKLDNATLMKAYNNFKTTMLSRNWKEDQLVFVVLAHSIATGNLINANTPSNIAVLKQEAIENWLGPSLYQMALNAHSYKMSSGPYASVFDYLPTKELASAY